MATDPNRFACAQEAALLRDAIAALEQDRDQLLQRTESARLTLSRAESALHDAQAVFATAQSLHASAKARENALEDEIREKRAFMHPVRKVPHDIWRFIFLEAQAATLAPSFFVPQRGKIARRAQTLAIRLASVCHRWRNTAQDIPALWRFIYLEVDDNLDSKTICAMNARLSTLRKRYAEGTNGRIVFDFYLQLGKGVARSERFEQFFLDVFWLLELSRSFEVVASNGYSDFRDSYLSQYFNHDTPHLESLFLTAECYKEDETDDAEDPSPILLRFSRTNYKKLFPACPRLRNVQFGNFPLQDYAASTPPMAPNIKHINTWQDNILTGSHILTTLRLFPCAPTMEFSMDSAMRGLPVSAQYNELRSLRLVIKSKLGEGFAMGLSLPGLERLKLDNSDTIYHGGMGHELARFLTDVCPNVADVTIFSFEICTFLAHALRGLSHLRILHIFYSPLSCDALFAPPSANGAARFPALEELHIEDAQGAKGFTGRQLLEFIRRRFRKDGGESGTLSDPPLRHVFVSWEDEQYSEPVNDDLIEDWDDQYREVVGDPVERDWTPKNELDELEAEFMSS